MPTNTFSPAVIDKAKDILLGEGVLYYNYGEVSQAVIGATRGGSKLNIDWTKRDVNFDGALGSTKGMRRTDKLIASLVIKFLKFNYTMLQYGLNVTVSDVTDQDGTFKKISFDTGFASTDVMTNIAFKGYKADGTYCLIIIKNSLNIDNIGLEFKEKDEVVNEMTYTGFYAYSTPTTPPILIQEEDAP